MKAKTICIGLALFTGVLGHSETARADDPCSKAAFLAGLCEELSQLVTPKATPPEQPPVEQPPSEPAEPPSDSNGAPTAPDLSGKSAPSTALPSPKTSSSSESTDSERSGSPVQDPVAVGDGESPATADLGEVGGGGGCTLAKGERSSPSGVAGLAALAFVIARIARRRGDES